MPFAKGDQATSTQILVLITSNGFKVFVVEVIPFVRVFNKNVERYIVLDGVVGRSQVESGQRGIGDLVDDRFRGDEFPDNEPTCEAESTKYCNKDAATAANFF